MTDYYHPEVLVSTQWVTEHAGDKDIQVVEVMWIRVRIQKGMYRVRLAGLGTASCVTPYNAISFLKTLLRS